MCGRYITPEIAAFERAWHIGRHNWLQRFLDVYRPSFNVTPSQTVPVIRLVDGQLQVTGMRWGLVPHFAKGIPGPYSTINARVETFRTSPAYRSAWKRGQRCLVPAAGFYEWQVLPDGKQPWYIGCADQEVFAFAGLWDASTPEGGEPMLSFTIITLPASPLMAQVHNSRQREPAILRRDDWDTWLGGEADAAHACLRPYPDALRSAWPVSKRVNQPKNDGPELLQKVASV